MFADIQQYCITDNQTSNTEDIKLLSETVSTITVIITYCYWGNREKTRDTLHGTQERSFRETNAAYAKHFVEESYDAFNKLYEYETLQLKYNTTTI